MNVDHVATLRQARFRAGPGASLGYGEPDVARAAHEAELGGADCITIHLREDRRHVIDRDAEVLARTCRVKLNLEMAGTDEMVVIATKLRPHQVTLVPEGRQEVTTEGGLDVLHALPKWREVVQRLAGAGMRVSAFIDADMAQIDASHQAGFQACELHTGPYAHAFDIAGGDLDNPGVIHHLEVLTAAARHLRHLHMRCNAGHALSYLNVRPVAQLPHVDELHIGHAIVARAVYVGLRAAVREMRDVIDGAAGLRSGADLPTTP